jgi:hypothetical protein
MFISEKRLTDIYDRIVLLESEVRSCRNSIDWNNKVYAGEETAYGYGVLGVGTAQTPRYVSLSEAIDAITRHLGVRIKKTDAVPSSVIVEKVKKGKA